MKFLGLTSKQYHDLNGYSFTGLFGEKTDKPTSDLLVRARAGQIKGMASSAIVKRLQTGERGVVYTEHIELIKPDTDPMDMDTFEFDAKVRLDMVHEGTGGFFVATSAVNGDQFIQACIKRNLYSKALLALLCSDLKTIAIIGVSAKRDGRIFISAIGNGSVKIPDAMKLLRQKAYAKGYKK